MQSSCTLLKGNGFVLITKYFKTFKIPVVNLQRICSSGFGRSSRTVSQSCTAVIHDQLRFDTQMKTAKINVIETVN